ncbi:MAG: ribonuclease P protein component [Desulfobacteraceae bacterium]|nr:ribonuclease P protein component [Desulfobacteraceae bacterium]MBC2753105.1 ribonuclease P protein component [Desulfobacteraceae bacterium]
MTGKVGLLRHGYPKEHRIRKRSEYLQLADDGKRLFGRLFILVLARREQQVSRLGITVTKKIGNAVTRNRLKRICREYFRTHKDQLGAVFDIHVIARSASAKAATDELTESLDKLFSQIK